MNMTTTQSAQKTMLVSMYRAGELSGPELQTAFDGLDDNGKATRRLAKARILSGGTVPVALAWAALYEWETNARK